MRKRIAIEDLRVGMYLDEFVGSWLDHPFWRARFRVEDAAQLQRLRTSGVREVWIDTARGTDVAAARAVPTAMAPPTPPATLAGATIAPRAITRAEEMRHAARLISKAEAAVQAMFADARMGRTVEARDALPLVEAISSSVDRHPGALTSLVRLKTKDRYTFLHSVAVCALMVALGRQLGLSDDEVRDAGLAGLLHDIGKIAIPPEVLNKPGALTAEEFRSVTTHPQAGYDILVGDSNMCEVALDVCLHHHERMDGTGYPHKLAGDGISLFARMGAICDVYDAITSDRPYKKAWGAAYAVQRMVEWRGNHFDPVVFNAFVKSVGIYPVGSLVRLRSGRLAVVMQHAPGALLTPTVKVFFSISSGTRIAPEVIDLAQTGDQIVSREEPRDWGLTDLDALWMHGD
ncbi:HD-GYP domain-containing protein [Ralstonia mannitolilytica]|uniref:Cyclic di-GMP phosphodiesterase response regulator RpfG n=1 Tax=Ralstonia mannitolilytica TaxID=105219 RepID=A0AAJ4ZN37_9RALS|nr:MULTISPECIES: HD-GYP domain-containing protein [Ralstonia]MBU9577842.1 HD-GYP domain-containing protein [Ralstonia mannitolilytica]PLT19924.1 HD-GYP domain-containing protein [Ralstonia mannitolilytica]CAG2144402.1 Cyclic di-GMP phosphodiesterase [Ralstonia mannitolilytica]CAJ0723852.1 Cyclic di-GMP phosphodiesterase [Ralstonia mannitolilytica]SUD88609.1 Cyclic di-GMP phosphodiesterase response regulator RpfG [Ralstonia mannitolilytica]